jgi:hypothetical protein
MKWKVILTMVSGSRQNKFQVQHALPKDVLQQQGDADVVSIGLEALLLSNPAEGVHLLYLLSGIVAPPSDVAAASTSHMSTPSHGDFDFKRDMAHVVARAIFHICLVHMDFREAHHASARTLLARICLQHPDVMSHLLHWSRALFAELGDLSIFLFNGLPIFHWHPSLNDLGVIVNMLKDPVKSVKFQLAKYIIDQLNWGVLEESADELAIPRSHHRFVAIAVSNICLDKFSARESRSLIASTTAFAQSAISTVGSIASMSFSNDGNSDFSEWCW